jgi:hypothetical protein
VAFARETFHLSERQACRLLSMDRSTYRYEPRPDHNAELREQMITLARQKPRYGYRRLHVPLDRRGQKASPMRVFRLYQEAGLAVRRLKRKRLTRPAATQPLHVRIRNGRSTSSAIRSARPRGPRADGGGYIYAGVARAGRRYQSEQPPRHAEARPDHRRTRDAGKHPLRQRAGADQPPHPRLGHGQQDQPDSYSTRKANAETGTWNASTAGSAMNA